MLGIMICQKNFLVLKTPKGYGPWGISPVLLGSLTYLRTGQKLLMTMGCRYIHGVQETQNSHQLIGIAVQSRRYYDSIGFIKRRHVSDIWPKGFGGSDKHERKFCL